MKKIDLMGSTWAAVAGALVGAGAYALDGIESAKFTPGYKAAAIMGGGAVLGLGVNTVSQDLGKGLIAGAIAIGTYQLVKQNMGKKAATTKGLGQALFNPPSLAALQAPIGNAEYAQLRAVSAPIGQNEYVTMTGLAAG
jgi:hypothetical protein